MAKIEQTPKKEDSNDIFIKAIDGFLSGVGNAISNLFSEVAAVATHDAEKKLQKLVSDGRIIVNEKLEKKRKEIIKDGENKS